MSALSYFITVLTLSLISSGVFICWQQAAIGQLLDESCPGSGAALLAAHTCGVATLNPDALGARFCQPL